MFAAAPAAVVAGPGCDASPMRLPLIPSYALLCVGSVVFVLRFVECGMW